MTMIDELTILRLVAIKGRVGADAIAVSLDADIAEVGAQLDEYATRELFKSTPMGYRITPIGRQRCTELVAAEHDSADNAAVTQIYDAFTELNFELKAVITDWQTRGPGQPNDHTDREYDETVLDRLQALHQRTLPLLDRIVVVAPRLGHYRVRLIRAADAVAAGDYGFVSKPIVDSYHTVWFELHEDLIGLAGLTRAEEAEAGRGA
jgi:pyruvate,orthophosphate dikinase